MESCHPGKCVCDLCPPLAESEWWKKKLSPSGKPAARLSVSLHIALSVHKQCTTYLQKRRKSYQCSKLLHLPFSNLGFWRDVDCCRFLFQTAMSWRSVSAPCKQCLSACRVSKKLQRCGCGPDQFLWELSIHQTDMQKTCDVQEAREAVSEAEEMRPVCKSLWMAWILPTSDLLLIPLFRPLGLTPESRCKKTPPAWCLRNWDLCCSHLSS